MSNRLAGAQLVGKSAGVHLELVLVGALALPASLFTRINSTPTRPQSSFDPSRTSIAPRFLRYRAATHRLAAMVAASSERAAADKSPEQPEQELSPQFVEGFAQGMDP
ncbi:hypothetical protein PF003_g5222 [Phytophthora fragariae]|nr:hypothetical protein PF003_g5222 [Phytophthora fragariae]